MINGVRKKQKNLQKKIKTKKLVGSALVVLIIFGILIAAFYMYSPPPGDDIEIDGDFSDWGSIEKYSMDFNGVSHSVMVDEHAVQISENRMNFYIKTDGVALNGGENQEMDHLYVFLNSPNDYDSKYQTPTIDASHMIKISGWEDILTAELYTYTNNTNSRNWYGWQRTASVPIERTMNEIEFSMLEHYLGSEELETYLVSKDYEGNIYCNDYVVMPGKPSLSVQQFSTDNDTVSDGDVSLELSLRAHNDDVTIDGIEFDRQNFTDIQFEGGDPFPINMDKDESVELSVMGSPNVERDETVSLSVSEIQTEATTTITGKAAVYYYEELPESHVIGGSFSDWVDNFEDSTSAEPDRIDIEHYNMAVKSDESLFYLKTQGDILSGTPIPEGIEVYKEELKDSDGDGIPDEDDPYPNDFTNDGTPDSEMVTEEGHPDVDGDGVADWPYGPDKLQNTTIPEDDDIPERYWGEEVSRYIGPRSTPEITGEDSIEIYVDGDGQNGFSIQGMRAEYKITIQGQYGEVTSSEVSRWDGEWERMDLDIEYGINFNEIEFKTGLEVEEGEYEVLFKINDWEQNLDQVLLSGEVKTENVDMGLNSDNQLHSSNTLASSSSLERLVSGDGTADEGFGWNVSYIGDFNGDGYDDLIVGAPYNSNGGENAGAAYIFYGYSSIHTGDIHASNANVTITGSDAGDLFGWDVAGNIDIDGNNAVVIGAPSEPNENGKNGSAYVFYDSTITGSSSLTADQADEIIEGERGGDRFGASVSGVGGLDGGTYDDFVVGAWSASDVDENGETVSYDYTGSKETIDVSNYGMIEVTMEGAGGGGGYQTGALGGDGGYLKAAIDVYEFDQIEIWVGEGGAYESSNDINATGGWGRNNGGNSSTYGWSGSGGGSTEIWGDGTFLASADAGGGGADTVDPGGGGGGARGGLGGTNGQDGNGEDAQGIGFGGRGGNATSGEEHGKPGGGKVNEDYLVSLSVNDTGGAGTGADNSADGSPGSIEITYYEQTNIGKVYIFQDDLNIPSSASDADNILKGISEGDMFGFSVSDGGDVDSDGNYDILVGAPGREEAYVYYGLDFTKETVLSTQNSSESFGWDITNVGNMIDTNGDSIAVGAPGSSNGNVYIFSAEEINTGKDSKINDTYSEFSTYHKKKNVHLMKAVSEVSQWDGRVNFTGSDIWFENGDDLSDWDFTSTNFTSSSTYDIYSGNSIRLEDNHDTEDSDFAQGTDAFTFPSNYVVDFYAKTSDDGLAISSLYEETTGPSKGYYLIWSIEFYDGNIKAYDDSSESYTNLKSYSPDTWYHVMAKFDESSGNYEVYINDTDGHMNLEASSITFDNTNEEEELWIDTGNSEGGYTPTLTAYVDQIKVTDFPSTKGYLNSTKTDVGGLIKKVRYNWNVTTSSTALSNTDINVNISRDGGITWNQSALTEGDWYYFPTEPAGNELVYNVTFKGDGDFTPILYDIKIEFSTLSPYSAIEGTTSGDKFGYSIASGNFSGDSKHDLIVGAPFYSSGAGAIYVFNGTSTFPASATASDSSYHYYGSGDQKLGWSVSFIGDMNSDTNPDIGVGSPFNSSLEGHADVLTAQIPEFPTIFFPIFIAILIPALFWKKKRQNV
ncbi:MAG: hypothetical protein ACOC89_00745 [Candidatus Saliniplasma sp.]